MTDKRSQVHVGDVGNTIYLTVRNRKTKNAIDISQATLMQILFVLPNSTEVLKSAGFYTDGTDGIVQYVIDDTITPLEGVVKYELQLTLPNRFWTSDPIELYVADTLSA
jgi:hypothetical protein